MLVPQGMAYALLAGMPPIYGLYGGLIPLIIYAIFGTSPRLSIGPVAISALLVLAGISQLAEPLSEEYIQLVLLTGLLVGGLQILLSVFRLGFFVNFLSQPVVLGFTSAAAVIIVVSQLKDLFGIQVPRFEHLHETVEYIYLHLEEINWATFLVGIIGVLVILLLQRINKRIPAALVAMIIGIAATRFFHLDELGVSIVGRVPEGLPDFIFPTGTWEQIQSVLPTVLAVCVIGIVESISIAKYLESKHRDHTIRPNQELLGLGLAKVIGSFFQAIPTSASFTRSAVNDDAGARTQISSIITAVLIGLTLMFLTPLFFFLPKAMLAAVILVAVRKLFHWKEALHFWKIYPSDFFMMVITFVVTLVLGVEEGVLAGTVLSIGVMVFRSSRPHVAVLGQIPETTQYRNIRRFPQAIQHEDMLIIRFDAQLYFGNASYFKDAILRRMRNRENVQMILLDASSIYDMDGTGIQTLNEVVETVQKSGKVFYISGALGPVRDQLHKSGLNSLIGQRNQFLNIHQAVECYRSTNSETIWKAAALQTNAGSEEPE